MKIGDLVKVEWLDINSESGWSEDWNIEPTKCANYGVFFGYKNDSIRLFAGFNDEGEIGDKIAIPLGVVLDIQIIKPNAW